MSFTKNLIIAVAFAFVLQVGTASAVSDSPCSGAFHKSALVAAGAVNNLELLSYHFGPVAANYVFDLDLPAPVLVAPLALYWVRLLVIPILRKNKPTIEGKPISIPETSRTTLNYLLALRLMNYDFRGRKILDVGAGHSRFAQVVNLVYKRTGTEAHSIDFNARTPGPYSHIGDAKDMPFENKEFDLVTSNFSYMYVHGSKDGFEWLKEMIRVTKPGGELRLRVINKKEHDEYMENFLQSHSRIVHYEYLPDVFGKGAQLLVVKL